MRRNSKLPQRIVEKTRLKKKKEENLLNLLYACIQVGRKMVQFRWTLIKVNTTSRHKNLAITTDNDNYTPKFYDVFAFVLRYSKNEEKSGFLTLCAQTFVNNNFLREREKIKIRYRINDYILTNLFNVYDRGVGFFSSVLFSL